ncbi:MAG: prepilin-type N-terminal cleavage/methylation domain-containing protein, partial [Nitrospirota bacterium]
MRTLDLKMKTSGRCHSEDDGAASREGLLPFARYGKGFSIHRSQSGFTLMEALLALAILSIIFA